MNAKVERVAAAAREAGLAIEVREFPGGTRTAEDAARAVGGRVDQIVKSLVFVADGRPILALVSGGHRADERKLATAAGAAEIRRANAEEARAATGFPIGGTPPFGHPRPLPVLFDRALLEFDAVWCAGGTPSTVFPVRPDDLLRVTGATVADLGEEPPAAGKTGSPGVEAGV